MSLSTEESSKAIAIDMKGQIIYYHDDEPEDEEAEEIVPYGIYNISEREALSIYNIIDGSSMENIPKRALKYYNEVKRQLEKKRSKEIAISVTSKNIFQVLPKMEKGQISDIVISGPNGAGKSTWAANYSEQYNTIWPENPVFLFSNKTEDPVFDDLDYVERVPLDANFDALGLDVDLLKNSLCIFDDIESIRDKNLKKSVYQLKDEIQTTGRSKSIYILIILHITRNGKDTKVDLSEADAFVLFNTGQRRNTNILLKEYVGLDKNQIEEILETKSRWWYIKKSHPLMVVTEKKIFLL